MFLETGWGGDGGFVMIANRACLCGDLA